MELDSTPDDHEAPTVEVAGLRLWVHDRPFADAPEPWDRKWLEVTAICAAPGAIVRVSGTILTIDDLRQWAADCHALRDGRVERSRLGSLEPDLQVSITPVDTWGHFEMTVEITPHDATQRHRFEFGIDQTHLLEIERSCRAALREFAPGET